MSAWNIRVIFEPDVSLHFFYQANIDKDDDDDYDDDEENENNFEASDDNITIYIHACQMRPE